MTQFNPTEQLTTETLVQIEIGSVLTPAQLDPYINWVSQYFLHRVSVYSLSTLYSVTETSNGTGTARLKLRNPPAQSITSVTVGSRVLTPSVNLTQAGYFLEDNQKFIAFRSSGGGYWWGVGGAGCFPKGIGNVQVVYQAGYSAVPPDIQGVATRMVGLMYKRKDSINIKTLAIPSGGSTTFQNDISLTKDIEDVIRYYARESM